MEEIKDKDNINKNYLGKKTKYVKKLFKVREKKNNNKKNKNYSLLFETSTDISSSNLITLEEKNDNFVKIPSFEDIIIPSFLNDITKYNVINRKINNYYKLEKEIGSPELAKLYLIDVKRLYEEKKKI